MFISDDENLKQTKFNIIGIPLKHKQNIKILGTTFSHDLKWNNHINKGNQSLLAQLKKRYSAIKYIKSKISHKFVQTLGNSIFYSKLLYHCELWGKTTLTNSKKIDKQIVKMARFINGKNGLGKTDEWNLK